MEYTKKSFSVGALPTEKYRSEWERIFGAPAAPQPLVWTRPPTCWVCGALANRTQNACNEHWDVRRLPSSETMRRVR